MGIATEEQMKRMKEAIERDAIRPLVERLRDPKNHHPAALRLEAANRIAELEARIEAIVAGAILPTDAVDEFTVDGVRWVRVPAEATVTFSRATE